MRYILIEEKKGDMFTSESDDLNAIIKKADTDFCYLTESEKKLHTAFYILESANEDEEAPDHFDGNVIKDYL